MQSDAAEWVVRLADEAPGEAEWLAFAAWLEGDDADARRKAFDAAQSLWLSIDPHRDHLLRDLSKPDGVGSRGAGRRRKPAWGFLAASALAASLVGAVALTLLMWRPAPVSIPPPALETYATLAGQPRTLHLPDGTRIDLDGATQITIAYAAGLRQITMSGGEADFDVAHDPRRPFVVQVGNAQARVLGTAFDIVRDQGLTRIGVLRGSVRFQVAQQAVDLRRGTGASYRDGTAAIRTYSVDPSVVDTWRVGRFVYRDRPLGEVVADLNRRFATPIQLRGAGASELRFTGVLAPASEAEAVGDLVQLLPLQVSRVGKRYVLDRRSP